MNTVMYLKKCQNCNKKSIHRIFRLNKNKKSVRLQCTNCNTINADFHKIKSLKVFHE